MQYFVLYFYVRHSAAWAFIKTSMLGFYRRKSVRQVWKDMHVSNAQSYIDYLYGLFLWYIYGPFFSFWNFGDHLCSMYGREQHEHWSISYIFLYFCLTEESQSEGFKRTCVWVTNMHKVTILIFHMDNFYGDFYFYVTIYIQCVKESSMNMDLNFYICVLQEKVSEKGLEGHEGDRHAQSYHFDLFIWTIIMIHLWCFFFFTFGHHPLSILGRELRVSVGQVWNDVGV